MRRERRLALGVAGSPCCSPSCRGDHRRCTACRHRYEKPTCARSGDHWTPISRVVGYPPRAGGEAASPTTRTSPPCRTTAAAGRCPTGAGGLGPQSVGYALTCPGRALIIGGGGGRDIYNALSSDRQRVDVIELNAASAGWSTRTWRPGRAGLHAARRDVAIGDGRSTLAARDTKYDTMNIGFTNTLAASGRGRPTRCPRTTSTRSRRSRSTSTT